MALDTYANLKTAILTELAADELEDQVDDFIDLAESRHKRDVRIREMITRESITIDDRYVDLPDGFLEMIGLRILTTPVTVLRYLNIHEMARNRESTTGKPSEFTVHATLEFNTAPDQDYTGEILYYGAPTPLSGSNESNAILSRAPGLYLFGACLAAAHHLHEDERIQTWASLYDGDLESLNGLDRRRPGPLRARVAGAAP